MDDRVKERCTRSSSCPQLCASKILNGGFDPKCKIHTLTGRVTSVTRWFRRSGGLWIFFSLCLAFKQKQCVLQLPLVQQHGAPGGQSRSEESEEIFTASPSAEQVELCYWSSVPSVSLSSTLRKKKVLSMTMSRWDAELRRHADCLLLIWIPISLATTIIPGIDI